MTQPSLLNLIHKTWEDAEVERTAANDPFAETPSVIEGHKLEEELADRFDPFMEQYNQGLISASEFLKALVAKSAIPSEDTEIMETES